MTTSHNLPIVGAHYRPPAKALLSILPMACPLYLEPEPENPFDSNALKVNLRSADIPATLSSALDAAAGPFGFTASDIFEKPSWHLGYIGRESAAELAAPVAEAFAINGEVKGELTLDPAGRPHIKFKLPSDPAYFTE